MAPTISNVEAMRAYDSYDLQWLGPIVFPLSFSIPTIAYVLYTYIRSGIRSAGDVVSFGIVLIETMFATFCWVQCIANFHNRSMSGGEDACFFQAVYATAYLFTSVMLVGLASLVHVLDLRMTTTCVSTVMVFCGGIFLAFLPYIGAGQYRFPKDFCMCDLEHPVYASLWLCAWSVSAMLLVASVVRMMSQTKTVTVASQVFGGRVVGVALCLAFAAFFSTPTIIDFIYVAGADQPGTIYGALAIILHTQQIGNPLLYGILWRSFMSQPASPVAVCDDAEKEVGTSDGHGDMKKASSLSGTAAKTGV